MKLFRKTQNPLFVEEEIYQWADSNSGGKFQLVVLGGLFIAAGMMFGVLN